MKRMIPRYNLPDEEYVDDIARIVGICGVRGYSVTPLSVMFIWPQISRDQWECSWFYSDILDDEEVFQLMIRYTKQVED